jgi:tripartite-type tricarboxylate transporter receptor subunit TctC
MLKLLAAIGLLLAGTQGVWAQAYPERAVRIVTADAGGGADFVARVLAQAISAGLGQPVVVENRPGAGGAIAFETVARAAADGHTLLLFSNGMWTLPLLQKVTYDPVKDFAPVSLLDSVPNVIAAHPSLPVKSVRDLIALAKARPGHLNWSAGSHGSTPHIAGELFKSMTRIDVVRISYKGTAPALLDLLAGTTQFMFPNAGAITQHMKSGRLRVLAIATAQRSVLLPELPTVAEAGVPGFVADTSHNLFAPAATPPFIIARLNDHIVRGLGKPDVRERLLRNGMEPIASTPEQLAATMQVEMTRIAKVIREAGIRAD